MERQNGVLQISVLDTGRGINPDFLPFVFDRFRQAESSSTRSYGGLGLGLAIARQLVELHGGTIRALSEGTNKGATIVVQLPLADVRQSPPEPHSPLENGERARRLSRRPRLDGVHVLVVDDEPDTRKALRKLLQQYHAHVEAVESAAAAIAMLRAREHSRSFDVLVSDIGMPVEDGYELIRQVRAIERAEKIAKPIRAVALSAYAREDDRAKAIAAGFHAHVAKPVDPGKLAEALAKLAEVGRD